MRHRILIAAIACAAAFAAPTAARRQSAGRTRHDRRHDQARALSRRRAEDRREFPRLRQVGALRRHAVPPRDPGLHDPGRRLRRRLQGEARRGRRSRSRSEQSVKAGLSNVPGTVAMARTADPNSATAQFFINVADNKRARFPLRRPRRATATRCSARSSRAWTSSRRSRKSPTGPGGPFPTDVPVERVMIKSAHVVDAQHD